MDPLLELLGKQIEAQSALAKALHDLRVEFAELRAGMDGMRRIAIDAGQALDRATAEQTARRLSEEAAEKRGDRLYDVAGRVVTTPWAAALGGGVVLWVLQRLGVAATEAVSVGVAP